MNTHILLFKGKINKVTPLSDMVQNKVRVDQNGMTMLYYASGSKGVQRYDVLYLLKQIPIRKY